MSISFETPLACRKPSRETAHDSGEVVLELLESSDRARAAAIWRAVEQECGQLPVMVSSDWTEAWLDHYGEMVPHRFAALRSADRYVGVMLLTQGSEAVNSWCPERVWHFGTAGEPDADSVCVEYNAVAAHTELRGRFLQEVCLRLQHDPRWDALQADGFAIDDLPEWMNESAGWKHKQKLARWVDLTRVRASGGELIKQFGDSTRKAIRQNLKKHPELRFEWAETPEHAHDIFTDLIALHQARWIADGQPGCYASRPFTEFHRDLIDRLVPSQRMLLARVSTRDRVLGCSQLLVDRNRVLVYQGGRVCDESGSPGLVTDFLCMQESLNRGYLAYDFMAGDSMHKRRLTTEVTPLTWVTWRRPRWKYRVQESLKKTRQWYRSALRGNPVATNAESAQAAGPAQQPGE